MRKIRWKDGVIRSGLKLEMRAALYAANKAYENEGLPEVVVISALDGDREPMSFHPFGFAVDIRTRYCKDLDQVRRLARSIRLELWRAKGKTFVDYRGRVYSLKYNVVVKKDHIHIAYEDTWNYIDNDGGAV